MRPWMTAPLPPPFPLPEHVPGLRTLTAADTEALARLMLDSYAGTIDDTGGETIDTSREEVSKILRGDFGTLDSAATVVIERDDALASATIITRHRGEPFLAFSMTSPQWKRHGLGRAGLLHAMYSLHARGEQRLHLVVTSGNTAAENLYRALGFVVRSPPSH